MSFRATRNRNGLSAPDMAQEALLVVSAMFFTGSVVCFCCLLGGPGPPRLAAKAYRRVLPKPCGMLCGLGRVLRWTPRAQIVPSNAQVDSHCDCFDHVLSGYGFVFGPSRAPLHPKSSYSDRGPDLSNCLLAAERLWRGGGAYSCPAVCVFGLRWCRSGAIKLSFKLGSQYETMASSPLKHGFP